MSVVVGVALLCRGSLHADTKVTIDHQPVGCLVAGAYPKLEARLGPADEVASARVYFKGDKGSAWYWVDMKPEAAGFSGLLPKPKKELQRIHYYIETTAKDLSTARTEEYTPGVVENAVACKGKAVAASVGSASVVVSALGGAPAIPAGFGSAGVVAGAGAGGGGIGTTALVVGGVAVAGAAAVVVAKQSSGDDDATSQCKSPNLTVLARSATTLTLQWTQQSPSGCYTVDYLTGVPSCTDFPTHGNIFPTQGMSVTLTGLQPSTPYHIHVHPLGACPNGGGTPGTTNVVYVNTLPAGSASQPVSPSDYQSCGPCS